MPKKNNSNLIGKRTKPIPVPKKEIGIDTTNSLQNDIIDGAEVSKVDMSALESFANISQTRESIYSLIDTMAQDDRVQAVLETYVEDSTKPNDSGKVVWCSSDNENVSKYVTYLLDSINVDKHAYSWMYSFLKNGDLYLRLYRESDYGDDLLFGKECGKESLNEDVRLNISEKGDHYVHYVEAVANPGEMFELTKFGKTMGYIKAPVNIQQTYDDVSPINTYLKYKMKRSDVTVYDSKDFVHACLQENTSRMNEEVNIFLTGDDVENNKVSASYVVKKGQSLLYNSFKIWRELSLLENSVILNRVTKSAIVRIINVDVGDMPKEQVNNFLTRLKDRIEQKSALNIGESMAEYNNPGPIENIIYVPTHGEQGAINAQNIGGDVNVGELNDLDYFLNKFYGALRVPKQYFNATDDSTGFNGGTSLSIISSRYGNTIRRIQNSFAQCITDMVNLFLLDKGLDNYVNEFTIQMQPPVTQEEIDKREDMRNRVGVISDEMNQISGVVKDEITQEKIFKILLSGAVNDAEVISLIQEDIDSREAEKNKGEDKEEEKSDRDIDLGSEEPFEREEEEEPELDIGGETEEPTEETPSEEETTVAQEENPEGGEESYLPSFDELNIDGTQGI